MSKQPEAAQNSGLMGFELVDVEVLTFVYREIPAPIECDHHNANVDVRLQWSDDVERFRSVTVVRVTPELDSDDVPEEMDNEIEDLREYELCVLENAVVFEPDTYSDYISDDELDMPPSMILEMSQVGLDTTRGVLSEKLRGTDLDTLTIPYVDVSAMANEDSNSNSMESQTPPTFEPSDRE